MARDKWRIQDSEFRNENQQGIWLCALLGLFALFASVAAVVLSAIGCSRLQQQEPNTLVMLIESSPLNLDPRIGSDAQSERISALIFDSLLRRDAHSNLQPWLAERWEQPDPLTYIFHLRRDVRFHNGQPLTARDVRYTFESLLSGQVRSLKSANFSRIASIETPDDFTVIMHLKEPYASFLWNLTQGAIGIVPAPADPASEKVGRRPIGSGPFRFLSAAQDEDVVIERNTDYWAGPPQVERVRFRVVPDMTTRALELRKGTADLAVNSLSADVVEGLKGEEHLRVQQQPGTSYQYIALNLEDARMSLPVRQALAYAIDRQPLLKYLWRDLAHPAKSILPAEHWAHPSDLADYPYDPEKAKALLDQAGFQPGPDGVRLRLEMKTSNDQTARDLAAVLQEQLRRVGIVLAIRSFEFATFYADIVSGNFDLYSLRWVAGNEDPDILEYCFASDKTPPNGANRGRYRNPEVDRLLAEARTSADQTLRQEKYGQVQRILNHDLPYIHLWYVDNVAVYSERLSGLEIPPNGNYDFLTTVRLNGGDAR